MAADPFQVLGVAPGASEDEIKQAYRRLAKQYHPDLHPGDQNAARKMNEINEAYDAIKNPAAYRQQQQQQQARQAYQQQQQQGYYDPFGFWSQQTGSQQSQDGPFYYTYTYRQGDPSSQWSDSSDEQNQQNQYQWTYRRTRRGGVLGRIFLVYILFRLMFGLLRGCVYPYYFTPYYYDESDGGYSQPYESQPSSDPAYGFGTGRTTG